MPLDHTKHADPITMSARCALAALCALAVLFAGCRRNDEPERVVVSGTVTFNGEPVEEGDIRFMPIADAALPMAGAPIKNGHYRVDGRGGVPVGTHKIEIEAYRTTSDGANPGKMPPILARGAPRIRYLPKRYNVESQLQISIESGSREIVRNFELSN